MEQRWFGGSDGKHRFGAPADSMGDGAFCLESTDINPAVGSRVNPDPFDDIPLVPLSMYRIKETYSQAGRDAELHSLEAQLQKDFNNLLRADNVLQDLIVSLRASGSEAVVFGGWVRDHLITALSGRRLPPRDIDLVVAGPAATRLVDVLPPGARQNIFGGLAAPTTTTQLDIWPLERTFLIVRRGLPVRFDTLPTTTVFRINSVIFRPAEFFSTPSIFEAGCLDALEHAVIDFQSREIPLPHVQVARAVMYGAKLRFRLTREVLVFIRQTCRGAADIAAVREGLAHYCPPAYLQEAGDLLVRVLDGGEGDVDDDRRGEAGV